MCPDGGWWVGREKGVLIYEKQNELKYALNEKRCAIYLQRGEGREEERREALPPGNHSLNSVVVSTEIFSSFVLEGRVTSRRDTDDEEVVP